MSTVRFSVPAETAYDFTIAPANRPRWQSSLRRVEDVEGEDGVPGQRWTDVTVPGLRPQMRLTEAVRPQSWTESGRWRGIDAELTLTFTPDGTGCTAGVSFRLRGRRAARPLAWLAARAAPRAVRADLRRAARILAAS